MPRPFRIVVGAVASIALLITASCTRAVSVGSEPRPVFAIQVRNALNEEMIVSYDDGTGARALGSVLAGGTERFVIASAARTTITVSARNAGGTRTAGPYTIQLAPGSTPLVTLR
jgi:hypothetical protein